MVEKRDKPICYLKDPKLHNLIAALQKLQEKHGYLRVSDLKKLSHEKGIPGTDIYGVATFYSQFQMKKPAKYTIYVCTGTACHVNRSADIIQFIEESLQIKTGETTKNRLIKLDTVNCIGACAKAPAIMVNDHVYGQMTKAKVKELILKLR